MGGQVDENSSEGEVEVPRVGAVDSASRSVLSMACEMSDGRCFFFLGHCAQRITAKCAIKP